MSRELDAEVAEKVMGWVRVEHSFTGPIEVCWDTGAGLMNVRDAPCFSTDIAAAWQILERMTPMHWPDVGRMADGTNWFCDIACGAAYPAGVVQLARCVEPTAPLAICRAALKALAT